MPTYPHAIHPIEADLAPRIWQPAWQRPGWARALARAVALALGLANTPACAENALAAPLRHRYLAAIARQTDRIPDQSIYLQSTESSSQVQGDVHAMLDARFAQLRESLLRADHWCEVLTLHLNVQYCRARSDAGQELLNVGLGRKFDEPLDDLHWLHFSYRVVQADDSYLQVVLDAPAGPMGTHDYRLVFEATPSADHHTVVHLGFGYAYGLAARLAMQVYLGTLARDKVGFSRSEPTANGQPGLVGGVRGVNERSTLRYFLAIEAYLGTRALPPDQAAVQSRQDWFTATERYPRQLHEIDRPAYLAMKLRQQQRQASTAAPRP